MVDSNFKPGMFLCVDGHGILSHKPIEISDREQLDAIVDLVRSFMLEISSNRIRSLPNWGNEEYLQSGYKSSSDEEDQK